MLICMCISASEFQRYLSQLPVSTFRYLNLPLDWDNEYDSDLIEIAMHLLRWEELLVRPFKFSRPDTHAIKAANQDSPELQRLAYIFLAIPSMHCHRRRHYHGKKHILLCKTVCFTVFSLSKLSCVRICKYSYTKYIYTHSVSTLCCYTRSGKIGH